MPIYIKELEAPPEVKEGEAKDAERVDKFIQSRNKKLSDNQVQRIERHLKKIIKSAKREYDPLRSRLSRYSDLLEGVVQESNFPFEGASNVTLRYAAGLARTYKSQFNKTVYADEEMAAPVFDPGFEKEKNLSAQDIITLQDGFNHSIAVASNAIKELKRGIVPALRDGTFLMEGSWERIVERVNDQRTYRSPDDFQKDYPSNKEAGISEEEYSNLMDNFLIDPDDCELVVRFSYNRVQKDCIEYRQILRSKFLIYPTTVFKISNAQMYGGMFELPKEELKRRADKREFYEDGVKKALARRGGANLDEWDRGRMFVEGRSSPLMESLPYKLADIVFKFDLDNDKTLEMYSAKVVIEGEDVYLLSCRPYDIRHNIPNVVAFRIVERDHAFDGISQIGDGEDIFNQVDGLFRHDNNVMMLTTSPMFIADENLKDNIDLGRAENVLRPGITFWVPNPDKMPIRQLPVQDIAAASGDNNQKIAILSRFVEMLIGVNQGESGNQTPDDPRAPAHKTALLMMSAGKRIDDGIDTWCFSLEDFFKLHATLLYQYSKDREYKFISKQKANPVMMPGMQLPGPQGMQPQQPQVKSFNIELLASDKLHWIPRKRSVALTPEYALNRLIMLYQTYMQMRPMIMQGDPVALEVWNRVVQNSGEPQSEKFLINEQQAPQLAQMAVMKALQQAKMQSDFKASAKGKEKLATESAKHTVKLLSDAARGQLSGGQEAEAKAQQEMNPSMNGGAQ